MSTQINGRQKAHVRLPLDWLDSAAYIDLSDGAKYLLTMILRHKYRQPRRGAKKSHLPNGQIKLTAQIAGELTGRSKATGGRLLTELQDAGWIEPVKLTKMTIGKRGKKVPIADGQGNLFRLTMFKDDFTGELPTNRWTRYGQPSKTRANDNIGPSRCAALKGCAPAPSTIEAAPHAQVPLVSSNITMLNGDVIAAERVSALIGQAVVKSAAFDVLDDQNI